MESRLQRFCVSWFSIRVCSVGTKMVVQAWNEHSIPGIQVYFINLKSLQLVVLYLFIGHTRGCSQRIPNQAMLANNHVAQMNPTLVPTSEQAVQLYQDAGGQLTLFNSFGEDPLALNFTMRQQRDWAFFKRYPTFDNVFFRLANGDDTLFREGLLFFIQITHSMSC